MHIYNAYTYNAVPNNINVCYIHVNVYIPKQSRHEAQVKADGSGRQCDRRCCQWSHKLLQLFPVRRDMYACIHKYTYHVYIYVCMYIYIYIYTCIYICVYICIHICIYTCIHIYVLVCIYMTIQIYMFHDIHIWAIFGGSCSRRWCRWRHQLFQLLLVRGDIYTRTCIYTCTYMYVYICVIYSGLFLIYAAAMMT